MTAIQKPVHESTIRATFNTHMQTGPDYARGNWKYCILKSCEELGIPIEVSLMGDTPAPGLREQLLGRRIDSMLTPVTWNGSKYIAICMGTNEPAETIIAEWTIRRGLPLQLIAEEYIILE